MARHWIGLGLMLVFAGCTDKGTNANNNASDDTGDNTPNNDDTGDTVLPWYPNGTGQGYLVDGTTDNSLFQLSMNNVVEPPEGQRYYGWMTGGEKGTISMGEIEVLKGGDLEWSADIGFNGLENGYNGFEARLGEDEASSEAGDLVWIGAVDEEVEETYQNLLLASKETSDGEGSLRSMESTLEILIAFSQDTIDGFVDTTTTSSRAVALSQVMSGSNGTALSAYGVSEELMPILGDDGIVNLILGDLDNASAAVKPGHPIKDLANYAYDCTQLVEGFAETAINQAGLATVCGSESSCQEYMADVVENLTWALDGQDENEDGTIELEDEGTIECAIFYVSQMAYQDVVTASW